MCCLSHVCVYCECVVTKLLKMESRISDNSGELSQLWSGRFDCEILGVFSVEGL